MARRTAFLALAEVYPQRTAKSNQKGHRFHTMLGEDFFTFAERAWENAPDEISTDSRHQRLYQPLGAELHDGMLLFKADVGFFGDPGAIVDAESREQILKHDGNISSTSNTRLALIMLAPWKCLMVVETARNGHLYNFMTRSLQHEAKILGKHVTFNFTRVERGDEWLAKSAYLDTVHIIRERKSSDTAHRGGEDVPANKYIFAASNFGDPTQAKKTLRSIIKQHLNPSDLLMVKDLQADDDFEVTQKITVTDGIQQRTFVLTEGSDPKTPSFRELIPTRTTSGIATDNEFISFCRDLAKLFAESGSM